MARFDADRVRRYYDERTPAFVAFGQGRDVGAIHRTVWAPGVADETAAFHYVDDVVADLIQGVTPAAGPAHVVDLGCGVGASLAYLAHRLPIRGTGVTVSPVQARLAADRLREAGVSDRVVVREGDFTSLPADIEAADLAFAIESFVHAPDPARFFAECARLVRPGGLLIVCDDVRRPGGGAEADRVVDAFREGWHVNTLATADELRALAAAAGFTHVSTQDLSPYLELRRMRDRVIAALVGIGRWIPGLAPRLVHYAGGGALQRGLGRGWIAYDLTIFRRA